MNTRPNIWRAELKVHNETIAESIEHVPYSLRFSPERFLLWTTQYPDRISDQTDNGSAWYQITDDICLDRIDLDLFVKLQCNQDIVFPVYLYYIEKLEMYVSLSVLQNIAMYFICA